MDPYQERDGTSDVAESCIEETNNIYDHDLTTKTWREDFCIIVEDKRLYVAKLILALASPVFERMFQREFKEKGENEMTLPGKKFDEVQEFLRCIYPSVISNALKIVALAEEYQVAALKSKCEACLLISIDEKTSAVSLCEILNLACLYSLQDLFHKCTTIAAEKPLAAIHKAEGEMQISLKAKCAIQRKIISKMEATNTKINLQLDNLKAELQRVTTMYTAELQRVTTMNNYHHAYTPEEARWSLDDYKGWGGTSLFLKIDVSEPSHSFTAEIGRTKINLEFKIPQKEGCVSLTLTASTHFHIKLIGSVVIANGTAGMDNFYQRIQLKPYEKSIFFNIIHTYGLKEKGYIHHRKIDVEVHILGK